ncbi:MAG: hypothetical protein ABI685_07415 [Ferruginibacter sp.]
MQNKKIPTDEQNYFKGITCFQKILFLTVLQLGAVYSQAQYYEEKPEPEIAGGIKVIKGKIIYGPKAFYITDPNSISLQAQVRYDAPLKIYSLSPYQQRYIDFVLEAGFLFCKANVFDSVFIDPNSSAVIRDHSKNPTYIPVYIGLCNRSVFSIGTGIFYWKGLGSQDIWGTKFLSLGYNAQNFRITVSGEWYAQTKNIKHSGTFFSVDFLWKYVIKN